MANVVKLKAGREWTIDADGVKSLRREYIVQLDALTGADGENLIAGLPAIGSAHPAHPFLYVKKHTVKEGANADRKTLVVTVEYAADVESTDGSGTEEDPEINGAVTEWGWDDGTAQKELTVDADGNAVVNSAGDVFERVPTVSTYAPTFTKVIKTAARRSGALGMNCKVNQGAVTIGGEQCAARTLLCAVSERRLFNDKPYNYQYTVKLRRMSNVVRIGGDATTAATDIGWDVAVVDAGMREIDDTTGEKKVITIQDGESMGLVKVTSPDLLDGHGHRIARSASGATPTPFVMKFKAYEEANFPSWFYSEPATITGGAS